MKIDLKQPIKDLAGKPIINPDKTDFTFGQALSEILVSADTGGKMKLFTLAQKIYTEKQIEVDEADFKLIKDSVEQTKAYTNAIVAGQILVYLEGLK